VVSARFLRSVSVGAINTPSFLAVIYLFKLAFGARDLLANLLGYVLGISLSLPGVFAGPSIIAIHWGEHCRESWP